ncbi:7,8-dihydro-8-oxoguanine triphosphatase [Paenibacillus baekrokdamisoli]|uniref:7,8-dihydro-8-oxoguanine triphosphatase n=1 Tax=Paenibacillus baekrokdamisoli TaxID=1712516 RepID=A0A3G9J9Z1_9BACL|nr:8-oxo-dGTP diphosphatase [Paenibacillus baekrokdamisoli]MBB3070745.1 8-oxo-dGTP diphosphatase [Paenibacillus baekrokdamisoli]BBH20094.1 7,8-dihydro-8-oxoguanine triphosphatase [Paenibacillus baekrokdamisoli]
MSNKIEYGMYTMCLVQSENKVLLINRPTSQGFPGYLGPGGKVDFPESMAEGAMRELWEETGLIVKPEDLVFKGIDEYVVPKTNYRYMVFNYLAQKFEGELLSNPPEGELLWVDINEALELPMQPWYKRRFPLFFEPGTFEISVVWDEDNHIAIEDKLRRLG